MTPLNNHHIRYGDQKIIHQVFYHEIVVSWFDITNEIFIKTTLLLKINMNTVISYDFIVFYFKI